MSKTLSSLLTLSAWLLVGLAGLALTLWVIGRGLRGLQAATGGRRIRRDADSARALAGLGFAAGDRHEPALMRLLERSWPAHRATPLTTGLRHIRPWPRPAMPALRLEAVDVSVIAPIGRRVGFAGIPVPVWQSVLMVRTGAGPLPRFVASPRGRWWFVPAVLGSGRPVVLADHPLFAARYRLQADDEAATRAWWTAAFAEAVLALPDRAWIETLDDTLLVYRRGRLITALAWPAWCKGLERLAAAIAADDGGPARREVT